MAEQQQTSEEIGKYFDKIDHTIDDAYKIATKARKKGYDPEDKIDIPIAKNMAERVIGLISALAPQIIDTSIAKRIQELEKEYGVLDWRVSLIIAEEIAKEKYCKFNDKKEAMEIGIRVGFAYHTLGTVASPLEGFSKIEIEKTRDGKEYFKVYFSGPIRSAGGTGASVSVLIIDYVRKKMGYSPYDPTDEEVKRYITELYDYHERVTNLQYLPSEKEIEFLAKNIPVQIAGDPSEKREVSNHKDLDRVETNRIRNGVCLVMGEGLAQKAPKLWKQLSKWGDDFDLDQWNFMEEFVSLQKTIKAGGGKKEEKKEDKEEKPKIMADHTFIKDLVAGRPVLTHPMALGGFRMRYGRSRTSGYSAASIHPYSMKVLNNYIGTGTQLKVERPGKGCVVSPCDTIEGPIVRLIDGSVVFIDSDKKSRECVDKIEEVIFLGDILFNHGDFLNRAHKLAPPGYCEEWWIQELEKATVSMFGTLDIDKLSELLEVSSELLDKIFQKPLREKPDGNLAIEISKKLDIPLHPRYTYHWKDINPDQFKILIDGLENSKIKREEDRIVKIILNLKEEDKEKREYEIETPKRILELIGVPHLIVNNEYAVIDKEDAGPFGASLGISKEYVKKNIEEAFKKSPDVLEIVNSLSEVKLRDKSGVYVGARMGRPEKAKLRKLNGSPQVLFPVGEEGGRLRCFQAALELGKIQGEFPIYYCEKCQKNTIFGVCETCETKTKKRYHCKMCGLTDKETCNEHGPNSTYLEQSIDIRDYFKKFLKKLDMRVTPDLIKGVRGTSNRDHIPEHLIKGILRAKHDIYVNKDGTIRYDMTQMPLTHFKPKEIKTSVEKLREIGYDKDIHGKPLENPDQTLEIKPLDVVLPACDVSPDKGADEVLFKAAQFCDELLTKLYGLKPYYNLKSQEDLAGHIGLALAPHTSAAIAVRIIGFSNTQGFMAHPMIHAATRRDCDGDEASVTLLMDAFLNFSRQYLPAHKGATQDAPLVMTSRVIPSEVDDMIFDMDIASKYPLEFYEACLEYKNPWEVDVPIFVDVLNTPKQYEGHGFTHDTKNINAGVRCSAYKILPSMQEKLTGQMDIAEKVRAVKTGDVARLVIEKHFIRDTKGNLRKFSMQEFRCVKCNEKFRRPPLVGKCTKCGGRIVFTISEGSVIKYLEPSLSLAEKYNIPPYLKQSLEILKRRIEGVFGREKERQEGLGRWFD